MARSGLMLMCTAYFESLGIAPVLSFCCNNREKVEGSFHRVSGKFDAVVLSCLSRRVEVLRCDIETAYHTVFPRSTHRGKIADFPSQGLRDWMCLEGNDQPWYTGAPLTHPLGRQQCHYGLLASHLPKSASIRLTVSVSVVWPPPDML